LPYDDPVLTLYDRLSRINDQVAAALEADAPGPELMELLNTHRTVMTDLEEAEAVHAATAATVSVRLAAARRLQSRVKDIQERLEQKREALVRQRKKILHTRQALDAYEGKT
jgi:hypothetical protein